MTKIKDMTQGKPLPLIIQFALPLMLGNVFQNLYTLVDTMVVGKALGVDALAALGATDWFYWMIVGIIQGVTQGFAIPISRHFGAKQYEDVRQVVGASTVLSAICSAALMLGGHLVTRPVLHLLQTPADIIHWSELYLRILISAGPVVVGYNLLSCILRALGDGQSPLKAMIWSSLTNIALDLLFVLGFDWGIVGAAAATVIAQVVACGYCLLRLRQIDFMRLTRKHFKLQSAMAGNLLGLGFPMAFQNAIIAIGGMIIQKVVNGYGVAFIAGFTATNKLYGILEVAATSYGYAMITYVGQNLGAQRVDRIRSGMRCAVAVAVATSLVIAAGMILLGRQILGGFISGTPEEVAQATRVGYTYLCYMSVCLPVLYILHVTRSAVQGMGNTVLPMVSGIAEFVMRTGCVLLLPALVGEEGIFVAEVLAWAGADVILIPSYFITMAKITKQIYNQKTPG